jgi:predicted short-subunit dehydrogenase-like oxidoreductase (DUF2520 family)
MFILARAYLSAKFWAIFMALQTYKMKVVIIGSGNVATVLGGKIAAAEHTILQVVARKSAEAARLAAQWGCDLVTDWADIMEGEAEAYIVALSDTALTEFSVRVRLPGRLVLHTAGAVPGKVLRAVSSRCGVLYPLQSLRREILPFPEFPLLIDAEDPADMPVIEAFARTLARQVQHADDELRLKLHVAAVVINNFSNYLYTLAADFCLQEGVDFRLLLPLIRETAARLEEHTPRAVQTGPAVRGDAGTMEKHLEILSNYKDLSELYKLFSIQIKDYYAVEKKRDGDGGI